MAHNETVEEVLAVVVKLSGVSLDAVLAADSIDDLLEPLAVIEIVFELEEKYGMEIDDNDVLAIESIDDLVGCVLKQRDVAA